MANEPKKPNDEGENLSFEQALQRLEGVVRRLEEGEIGLDEAMSQYEQGVRLVKLCGGLLNAAERKIELLSGVDSDGNPICEPFDDRSTAQLDAQGERRRRRTIEPKPKKSSAARNASRGETSEIDEPPTLF